MVSLGSNPYYRHAASRGDLFPMRNPRSAYTSGRAVGCFVPKDPDAPWWARRAGVYDLDQALRDLAMPVFGVGSSGAAIAGSGAGKLCTPWHYYLKLDPTSAMRGSQKTGDCVSWGIRGASDTTRCFDILGKNEQEAYVRRQATCGIYAGRGHTGSGASPARLSEYHVHIGIVLEQQYTTNEASYDFRHYDEYVVWGMRHGQTGVPEDLRQLTSKHGPITTSLVVGMEELKDLLWNGYGVHCGSGIGVTTRGDPVSHLTSSWSHDMQICGYDDSAETRKQYGQTIYFWDQSWGDWNRVENIPDPWKPWGQGMFALKESDTWQAVRQQGTWVFSGTNGFPARPIDNLLI